MSVQGSAESSLQGGPGSVDVPAIIAEATQLPAAGLHFAFAAGVVSAFCAGPFYHPMLAASFRLLDELGHPARVRIWGVEREPKIRKEPVFQFGVRHLRPDPLPASIIDHGTSFPQLRPGSTSGSFRYRRLSPTISVSPRKDVLFGTVGPEKFLQRHPYQHMHFPWRHVGVPCSSQYQT